MARVLDYIFFRLSTAVGWLAAERDWCVLHWPSGLITFSVFLLLLGQPFETETRPPLSTVVCVSNTFGDVVGLLFLPLSSRHIFW